MHLPPPTPAAVRAGLEEAVGPGPWRLETVSSSSNFVLRADHVDGGRSVAVRVPRVVGRGASAFWDQMGVIFGLSLPPSPDRLARVAGHVSSVGGLAAPSVLGTFDLDGRRVVVTEWLEGDRWEPDELPPCDGVHADLGRFLARMHGHRFDGFGTVDGAPLRPVSTYAAVARASVDATLRRLWPSDAHGPILGAMTHVDDDAVASACALVMPDLSANQFLFDAVDALEGRSGGGLRGVVDLDAYVVGPVELELTMAEWCVTCPDAFLAGYESVRPLPTFAPFRSFHRATMLVNEPSVAGDLERLLHDRIHFP